MQKTKLEIIHEIKTYMESGGGSSDKWYVGVTDNPEYRLFKQHNLDKFYDFWIVRNAENQEKARDIEKYFVEKLKTLGTTDGNNGATYVYAYKKNRHTKP
ncbi:MAG: hypothetical protein ABIB71_05600 [Candidatus Woesearchaeota archaeon]